MSRLVSLIPRLTAPALLGGDLLPRFGEICQRPAPPTPTTKGPNVAEQEERPQLQQQSPTVMQMTDAPLSSHEKRSIEQICKAACDQHRVIFLGEQHHQPKVLSGQLQFLHQFLQQHSTSSSTLPKRRVHVVFEQWSLADQAFLHKVNQSKSEDEVERHLRGPDDQQSGGGGEAGSPEGVTDQTTTSEGFRLDHYAVLLRLVHQLGGTSWGGFPPRSWARLVAKGTDGPDNTKSSAFDRVQQLDKERYDATVEATVDDAYTIPPLPNDQYIHVEQTSWAHRTYLKSMFAPDQRPTIVAEAAFESPDEQPPPEQTGFLAAQSLKDTFFAHVISTLLARDPDCIVVAVCGLGHCEWSFGAPERVQKMMPPTKAPPAPWPYVIISKPIDSAFWPANDSSTAANLQGDQWQRKQADTVFLYEWID